MKLKFLGTGAADWTSDMAGQEGYRARTSTQVGDCLLIDGTMGVRGRISDPAAITDIAYTHSHDDHFDPELLRELAPVRAHIHVSWAHKVNLPGVTVVPFELYEEFEAGGCTLKAVPANHLTEDPAEQAVHYIVRDGERAIYYGTDGGWMMQGAWGALQSERLDAFVFEATIGEGYPGECRIFGHTSVDMLRMMVRALRQTMVCHDPAQSEPILRPGAPVFITHMASTLHPSQQTLERALAGEFVVTYDGLEAEV